MNHVTTRRLKCTFCGKEFPEGKPVTYCQECGSPLSFYYNPKELSKSVKKEDLTSRETSIWRYKEFLPTNHPPVSLGEGWTPLIKSKHYLKGQNFRLLFKLEFLNPSGSFKDRGTSVLSTKIQEWGLDRVADDSSGNAGASLAAYSAKAGVKSIIYVPANASGDKIIQIQSYGAKFKKVPGPRENAAKQIKLDCDKGNLYYASHNSSPYFQAGMKTVAYEIAEQLNWAAPDHVVMPVGGGSLFTGTFKGFHELYELGWIEKRPKLHAIQSKSCCPIVTAFKDQKARAERVEPSTTVAEGIDISKPDRDREILESIRMSEGGALAVKEMDIQKNHAKLAKREGIFCEPTSAATLAGVSLLAQHNRFNKGETVVVPITGSGLKDLSAAKDIYT